MTKTLLESSTTQLAAPGILEAGQMPLALRPAANPELIGKLKEMIDRIDPITGKPRWSRNKIADALGINPAYVSIYVRQLDAGAPPFPGNLVAFEGSVSDLLKRLGEKKITDDGHFNTAVCRQFEKFVTSVRSVDGIGVYHGDAGIGKTFAIAAHRKASPLSIGIDVYTFRCGRDAILNALFKSFDTRGWSGNESRAEWIIRRLEGRVGALIFDNAHKLTHSALSLIFDIHDRTGYPIVLVGNPSIITNLQRDDQLFSRVGLKAEATYTAATLRAAVEALLGRETPRHVNALLPMALKVGANKGRLRAVNHHLRVTMEFASREELAGRNITEVFKAAHAALIHTDFSLD